MGDEKPIWTHAEHMAWGRQSFRSGVFCGVSLAVFVLSLAVAIWNTVRP